MQGRRENVRDRKESAYKYKKKHRTYEYNNINTEETRNMRSHCEKLGRKMH